MLTYATKRSGEVRDEPEAIKANARLLLGRLAAGETFSPEQISSIDVMCRALDQHYGREHRPIKTAEDFKAWGDVPEPRQVPPDQPGAGAEDTISRAAAETTEWPDKDGNTVRALRPDQHLIDYAPDEYRGVNPRDFSIGRAVRAHIVGSWRDAELEERALGTGVNTLGGFLTPDALALNIIDLTRAKSVVFQAGARTIEMPAAFLTIARLLTDPGIEAPGENQAFTEGSMTFDAISLSARKIGRWIPISRELVEDSPNAAEAIEAALSDSLVELIDKWCMRGDGTSTYGGIVGITAHDSVQQIDVSAAVDWDDLLDAIEDVHDKNAEAGAWITSPGQSIKLAKLKVNSEANHYASPPPEVTALRRLVSTQCVDGQLYLGDFRQVLFGVRKGAQVEISTEAGDAFKKHQVYMKIVLRGDIGFARPDHIVRLINLS